MKPEDIAEFELRVRADERLKVLREIRSLASNMDRNPANDPYLWGYGAGKILAAITKRLAEHRNAMGIKVPGPGKKRETSNG